MQSDYVISSRDTSRVAIQYRCHGRFMVHMASKHRNAPGGLCKMKNRWKMEQIKTDRNISESDPLANVANNSSTPIIRTLQ